ncbi:MAG: cytochrome c [Paracoccaceae bacterium]|nr:cytochrome c [Paracoccaceae bacterium]
MLRFPAISTPLRLSLALGLTLAAGVALAKDEAQNPVVRARMEAMQKIKVQTGILGDMASGKTAFDATQAAAAKDALITLGDQIEPLFAAEEDDPASDALPDLWANPGEFRQKANRMIKGAMALETGSARALGDSMNALTASCKDCHGRFKM